MHVKLLAYKNHIIVIPSSLTHEDAWIPSGNRAGHFFMGSVLLDTKAHLLASMEAIALLQEIRIGDDAIGDWDWFKDGNGKCHCGWFGAIFRIINPRTAEAARGAQVYIDHVTIVPNDVDANLAAEIDAALLSQRSYYREPLAISDPEPPEMNN